jgi:hypothetical protein
MAGHEGAYERARRLWYCIGPSSLTNLVAATNTIPGPLTIARKMAYSLVIVQDKLKSTSLECANKVVILHGIWRDQE